MATGKRRDLEWLERSLKKKFDCKSKWIGPRKEYPKSQQVLGRIITRTPEGIVYEADPRHAETLIEAMGLQEAKPVSTPGSKEPAKEEPEEMTRADQTNYRAMAARCNYLSLDRPDIQYASKEVCRWMQGPTWSDWLAIKRIARYLK